MHNNCKENKIIFNSIENEIENYSNKISILTERNHTIKNIDDKNIQKEYKENNKLIEEYLNKLKILTQEKSTPLNFVENKNKLQNVIKRRYIFTNAFEIYGGISGLFDLGPTGSLLKSEIEKIWRHHFVFYDEMLEINCTCLTPYEVLKTSGHVDRFNDIMIKDEVNNECFRADKYLEDYLSNKIDELKKSVEVTNKQNITDDKKNKVLNEINDIEIIIRQLSGMNENEIQEVIKKYNIKSPNNNSFSDPYPFNLMFETRIGQKDEKNNNVAYLRPETAQGIFVNFKKLLEYNNNKLPFASAQIGLGFRNEISPRNGLLRVREFQMAEIEYFFNPNKKNHEKYYLYKHLILPLYTRQNQLTDGLLINNLTLEQAVQKKIIQNEALAYFLARTYLFLLKCGINKDGIRFRQHLKNEMAHYASDCWDAEILTSFGFIEVVGHADRSAYDLTSHSKSSNINLYGYEKYDEPKIVDSIKIIYNKAIIGNTFKQNQKQIFDALNEKSTEELLCIDEELNKNNIYNLKICNPNNSKIDNFELTRDMISFEKIKKKIQEETFIPNVIEPSFGIGRLIYCILEHTFRIRDTTDDERTYFKFPYKLAPIKSSILSISNNNSFYPYIKKIQSLLNTYDITFKLDNSSVTIGKKYARTDEIGIPFAITIDFQTLKDETVTIRDRDTMTQIRINIDSIVPIITSLIYQTKTWKECVDQYGLFYEQKLN